ncbi:MAG: DUF5703 domain-containing protein [Thermoproteota archaeon]
MSESDDVFDAEKGLLVWKSPSKFSSNSMPIGNGDIGLNVWIEENAGLLFYVSKMDAWDENARLVKVGKVRIRVMPNPFSLYSRFLQILKLKDGEIEIRSEKENTKFIARVWVDANHPVIRVELSCNKEFEVAVTLELWRTEERKLTEREVESAYGLMKAPYPIIEYPDMLLSSKEENAIIWCHRNIKSIFPETMILQGLEEIMKTFPDPLLNRTFGGLIEGKSLILKDNKTLRSIKPNEKFLISIYVLTAQTETLSEWLLQLKRLAVKIRSKNLRTMRASHRKWWRKFWKRSWIYVSGDRSAEITTRGYMLQRFINAIAGRGLYPIKFNGSIFTFDNKEEGLNADYRRWGGLYWFQNTRLIYWSMLKSGDFDLMKPLFKMYSDSLPMAEARTKIYFNHGGAFFPETMYFFSAYGNDNYGWERFGKHVSYIENGYIRYYWQGGIELVAIMLDFYFHTLDEDFLRKVLLPFTDAIIQFYDEHYPRDENGKIRFEPAQSLETWWDCVNPLPEIVGLAFILKNLLLLTPSLVGEERRLRWQKMFNDLPSIPIGNENGEIFLLPAEKVRDTEPKNIENPELYAVFPYRIYGVGKPGIEIAQLTYFKRRFKGNVGWQQDVIHAAYLGLTTEAQRYLVERFSDKCEKCRFPAFWGPNFDWVPDQDHGNVGLIALQAMLMHDNYSKIILFPAWPRNWNVKFKIYASFRTTIEGIYEKGKIKRLKVTPNYRKKDIEVINMK